MGEVVYSLKVLVVTAIFVAVMQVQVGNNSLENHAHLLIQKSWVGERVEEVTAGGWKLLRDGYKKISHSLGQTFDRENSPGERKLGELKRSTEHFQEVAKKKGVEVEELIEEAQEEASEN